jgi:pimeloyl-ACP methyl ester carboxylesterase
MAELELAPGARMHYVVDDFTDPWTRPDCVLMLHGIAETSNAWRMWVPHFARRYRVVRPDLRGFGRSSGLEGVALDGVATWADDIEALAATLGCARVHVIGAKLGALVGMELGRRRVPWMATLTIAGLLISPKKVLGPFVPAWFEQIDTEGIGAWARATMPGRLGPSVKPEEFEWWVGEMSRASAASVKACLTMVREVGEADGLEQFVVPTLVMVAGGGPAPADKYEQRQSLEAVDRFRSRIPRSQLAAIDADSYHIAGTHPDACAQRALRFIESQGAG